MKRGLIKTASGIAMNNSSPAAIEEALVSQLQEALGQWKDVVRIKPFLQIDEEDADLTGNVRNAFGAVQLSLFGVNLYIPFIIVDKMLLPFDTIRMGEQEVPYDYSKLRRLVNAIETKSKSGKADDDDPFKTMEVAKFEDVQPNNGFLGTIMGIRDTARMRNGLGLDNPWDGPGFGDIDDDRVMRQASTVDVLNEFHEVMEKIANVKVYTKNQLEEFEQQLLKQAEQEVEEELEKVAESTDTIEAASVRRDMLQLDAEKLVNVHRIASGNNLAFPIFEGGRFEYRSGRVYRNFDSWFKNSSGFSSGKLGALVIDSKAGYRFLKSGDPFMASTREPGYFELETEGAKALKDAEMYTYEKDHTTLFNPFTVKSSFLQDKLNDGIVVSVREIARTNGHHVPSRTSNSLFFDAFKCFEVMPGNWTGASAEFASGNKPFFIVISKDHKIKQPTFMNQKELMEYVVQHAADPQDAMLAKQVIHFTNDTCIIVPENLPFFKLEKNITYFYTRPDGLFKEGPMSKTAAYGGLNQATLVLENGRNPKVYGVKWQHSVPTKVENDIEATRLEKRSKNGMSEAQAKSMLRKLGFDYRTQEKFFEITNRNGRSATFNLPNPSLASQVSGPDVAKDKVNKKMKGIANSLLNSQNFMPLMENAVADGLSSVVAGAFPSAVNAVHNVANFMDFSKQSMETALGVEKIATKFNGAQWHELSALLNMKHRLDKLAAEMEEGSYLQNGREVFEKVAELKPVIEKKASELIQFNRDQLIRTDSYLVEPSLVKHAIAELDGLYVYASAEKKKSPLTKSLASLGKVRR